MNEEDRYKEKYLPPGPPIGAAAARAQIQKADSREHPNETTPGSHESELKKPTSRNDARGEDDSQATLSESDSEGDGSEKDSAMDITTTEKEATLESSGGTGSTQRKESTSSAAPGRLDEFAAAQSLISGLSFKKDDSSHHHHGTDILLAAARISNTASSAGDRNEFERTDNQNSFPSPRNLQEPTKIKINRSEFMPQSTNERNGSDSQNFSGMAKSTEAAFSLDTLKRSPHKSRPMTGLQRRRALPFSLGTAKPKISAAAAKSRMVSPTETGKKRQRKEQKVQLCSVVTGGKQFSVIVSFDSIQKTSEATEMSHDRIRERIQEGQVAHKSFFWRFQPEIAEENVEPDRKKQAKPVHTYEDSDSSDSEDDEEEFATSHPLPQRDVYPEETPVTKNYDDGDDEFTPSATKQRKLKTPLKRKHSYMVEQISMETDEVVQTHKSISAASKLAAMDPSLLGKRMKVGRVTSAGFHWRFADNQGRLDDVASPPVASPSTPSGPHYRARAVEKVNRETGQVVAKFESQTAASRSIGMDRVKFRRMLALGPVEHNGYLWRNAGSEADMKMEDSNNSVDFIAKEGDDADESSGEYDDESSRDEPQSPTFTPPKALQERPHSSPPQPAAALSSIEKFPQGGSNPQRSRRTIEAVNVATGHVSVFYSQKEGADFIDITASYLSRLLKRAPVEYKGYMWRYKVGPDGEYVLGDAMPPRPATTQRDESNTTNHETSKFENYDDSSSSDSGGSSFSKLRAHHHQRTAKIDSVIRNSSDQKEEGGDRGHDFSDDNSDDSSLSDASDGEDSEREQYPMREKRQVNMPSRYADMTVDESSVLSDYPTQPAAGVVTAAATAAAAASSPANPAPILSRRHISRPRRRVEKVSPETNEVLDVYQSQSAACRVLGTTNQHFSSLMKQAPILHKGYIWRFENDGTKKRRPHSMPSLRPQDGTESTSLPPLPIQTPSAKKRPRGGRPVERVCLKTGKLLQTHSSQKEACEYIGTRQPAFSELMKYAPTEHKGFLWRFAEDVTTPTASSASASLPTEFNFGNGETDQSAVKQHPQGNAPLAEPSLANPMRSNEFPRKTPIDPTPTNSPHSNVNPTVAVPTSALTLLNESVFERP